MNEDEVSPGEHGKRRLVPFSTEWWHFDDPDCAKFEVLAVNPYTKPSDRPSVIFDLPVDIRSLYSVLAVLFAIMGMFTRRLPTDSPRTQIVVTFSFLALAAMFVALAWLAPPAGG